GPVLEPLRMLGEPRMVGRALQREVERDLEPVFGRGRDEVLQFGDRAELGGDGVVPAFLRADRPRASGVARRRFERVVPPLPERGADRMDRGEVENVEAELGEPRHVLLDARKAAEGAGKELVPGTDAGALSVDDQLERVVEGSLALT